MTLHAALCCSMDCLWGLCCSVASINCSRCSSKLLLSRPTSQPFPIMMGQCQYPSWGLSLQLAWILWSAVRTAMLLCHVLYILQYRLNTNLFVFLLRMVSPWGGRIPGLTTFPACPACLPAVPRTSTGTGTDGTDRRAGGSSTRAVQLRIRRYQPVRWTTTT